MGNPGTWPGDLYVRGNLAAQSFSPPAGSITDAAIVALAGISASKLRHQHRKLFSQPNTTATTETRVLHIVVGATGTVTSFSAGSIVANIGAATVTANLMKNGVSILTGAITLNNANTAYVPSAGVIASAGVVAGDVLSVVLTATAGGGTLATGVFAQVSLDEDYQ
jgi:hypothetical protein